MQNKTLNIQPNMSLQDIAKAYSDYFGLPIVELTNVNINKNVIKLIDKDILEKYKIIIYELNESTKDVKIAVAEPQKLQQKAPKEILELKKSGYIIHLAITTISDLNKSLEKLFSQDSTSLNKALDGDSKSKTGDVIVNKIENNDESVQIPVNNESGKISLINKSIPYEIINKFPEEVARKYQMVVYEANDFNHSIKVAALEPESKSIKEIIEFVQSRNHLKIDLFKTDQKNLDYALKLYQQKKINQINPVDNTDEPTNRDIEKDQKQIKEDEKEEIKEIKENEENASKDGNSSFSVNNILSGDSMPQAKPLAGMGSGRNNLPPLNVKRSHDNGQDGKLNDVKEIKIDELDDNKKTDYEGLPQIGDDEENNLDLLFPSGIKDDKKLSNVITSGIVTKIVSAILYYAVELEASDIHLEPAENDFRLRYRIDGMLQDIIKMPKELHAPVISRIKIISKLKIDEQRIPQDGRFDVVALKKNIDLRVSTFPTVHGEKVVMRILDKSGGVKTLEDLGFSGTNLKLINENIVKPHGIILVTGPTGSGKSTTLYAVLNKISKPEVNIITLEDPVEYDVPGINQCQIKPKIGFGFAEGLRSILRQDPDIIMVGEIRDAETASMATHAALTGHLVLTTLHTNDAAGALPRLINMGIEPFLITSSINCIIAQRLVRKLCKFCREEYVPPQPVLDEINEDLKKSKNAEVTKYADKPLKFYRGRGCDKCNNGYKGRIGLYEVLHVSGEVENLTVHKEPASKILEQAISEGMITIKQDGIIKATEGFTTLDEVLRVTIDD
jgi:type IV pilus assembly protein PilB